MYYRFWQSEEAWAWVETPEVRVYAMDVWRIAALPLVIWAGAGMIGPKVHPQVKPVTQNPAMTTGQSLNSTQSGSDNDGNINLHEGLGLRAGSGGVLSRLYRAPGSAPGHHRICPQPTRWPGRGSGLR